MLNATEKRVDPAHFDNPYIEAALPRNLKGTLGLSGDKYGGTLIDTVKNREIVIRQHKDKYLQFLLLGVGSYRLRRDRYWCRLEFYFRNDVVKSTAIRARSPTTVDISEVLTTDTLHDSVLFCPKGTLNIAFQNH
jgi:hypothetical protein